MAGSEPSTSAPAPTQHMFLHELPKQKTGTKVRFLCCVLEYDSVNGKLHVEHAYPIDAPRTPKAHVDINLVLESARRELFAKGAWLNVIGYVLEGSENKSKSRRSSANRPLQATNSVVQAVLIWDAGAIKVKDYETTMEKQREAFKRAKHAVQHYK